MSYVMPADFVTKMIDAGAAKVAMSTRDTLIRAFMAGAILALAAAFAVTVTVRTGEPLLGPCCSRSGSACCTCWASTS
ncbi:Formate/nitrite family of transporters [Kocuria rosea]|nr:Formate/nitrite family of transporters [Kocuria rosea]